MPLYLRVGSGNESDSAVSAAICQEFKQQLNLESLIVVDSALYSAPNLEMLTNYIWLIRVPLSLKQAQQLVSQLNESEFTSSSVKGDSWSEHKSSYGRTEQRWLVVESNLRRDSDRGKLENKLKKAEIEAQNKLRKLSKIEFACAADAAAAHRLSKQLKYYNLTQISSRQVTVKPDAKSPASATGKLGSSLKFKVQAQLEADAGTSDRETKTCGRFILATNLLKTKQLKLDEMIVKYKEQQSTKREFGFLKDPYFLRIAYFSNRRKESKLWY